MKLKQTKHRENYIDNINSNNRSVEYKELDFKYCFV